MSAALSIRVEARTGSSLYDACFEAWELAKKLGVAVVFEFNGDDVVAQPGDENGRMAGTRWWESRMKRQSNTEAPCRE